MTRTPFRGSFSTRKGGSLPAPISAQERSLRFGSMRANRSGAMGFRDAPSDESVGQATEQRGCCPCPAPSGPEGDPADAAFLVGVGLGPGLPEARRYWSAAVRLPVGGHAVIAVDGHHVPLAAGVLVLCSPPDPCGARSRAAGGRHGQRRPAHCAGPICARLAYSARTTSSANFPRMAKLRRPAHQSSQCPCVAIQLSQKKAPLMMPG